VTGPDLNEPPILRASNDSPILPELKVRSRVQRSLLACNGWNRAMPFP